MRRSVIPQQINLAHALLFIQRGLYNMSMQDAAKPESGQIAHTARLGAFGHELAWTLEDNRLLWRSANGQSGAIASSEIIEAQTLVEPALFGPAQSLCRLRTRSGARFVIPSVHSLGAFRREDRSESWRELVDALLRQMAQQAPQAHVRRGLSPLVFRGVVAALICLAAGLAAAFAIFGEKLFTARLGLGLALVALGLPNLLRWLRDNRPGRGREP